MGGGGGVEDISPGEGYTGRRGAQGRVLACDTVRRMHPRPSGRGSPSAVFKGSLLLVVAAASLARGPDAAAQPRPHKPAASLAQSLPPDARRDYDAGKLLFEDGDYATALLKYQ